jgi:hypothetical protein
MSRKRMLFRRKKEGYLEEEGGLPTGRRMATSRKKALFLREEGWPPRGRRRSSYGKSCVCHE